MTLSFSPAGFILFSIWLYRKLIAPWIPDCCRFTPTCSQYAIESIRRFGAFKGSLLAAWRIMRCQPFCKGGYDPVPPANMKTRTMKSFINRRNFR